MGMGRRRTKDFDLPPRMLLRGTVYYYKSPTTYCRLAPDWATAYAKYLDLEGPQDRARTVGQALTHYCQAVLPGKAAATQREYKRYAKRLQEVFGDSLLGAIDSSHIAQYLRKRTAPKEANREASMLSSVYQEAMAQGWVSSNPCRGVRRNPESASDIIPTASEIDRLLLAAGPQMRAILDVELLTAARKKDLLSIRLADWSDEGLHLVQSKTGARLLYERMPELEAAVARAKGLRRRVGSLYLFAGRLGQPITESGFDTVWQKLRAKAGVRHELTFHSLRAYVITEAERRHGIDYARRIAGHKSASTTARYVRGKEIIRVRPMARGEG